MEDGDDEDLLGNGEIGEAEVSGGEEYDAGNDSAGEDDEATLDEEEVPAFSI